MITKTLNLIIPCNCTLIFQESANRSRHSEDFQRNWKKYQWKKYQCEIKHLLLLIKHWLVFFPKNGSKIVSRTKKMVTIEEYKRFQWGQSFSSYLEKQILFCLTLLWFCESDLETLDLEFQNLEATIQFFIFVFNKISRDLGS